MVESYPTGEQLWNALVHRVDTLGVPPDLIVTDVRMPGRTGLEVVQQLRRYDRVTPVIVVTACARDQIDMLRLPGVASVVQKGLFTVDSITALIRKTITPPKDKVKAGEG